MVEDGKRTGKPEADWAIVRVGRIAERGAACAEHFGLGFNLGVDFEADGDEVGHGEIWEFRLGKSETQVVEKFLQGWVVECLGESRVLEECVELSRAGKILELWVVNDNRARVGASSLWVDDGFERRVRLGGNQLGECDARRLGVGVHGCEPRLWNGRFHCGFEIFTPPRVLSESARVIFFGKFTNFFDRPAVVDVGRADQPDQSSWDDGEAQAEGGANHGPRLIAVLGISEWACERFADFPAEQDGADKCSEREAIENPRIGFAGDLLRQGGSLLPDEKTNPRAQADDPGADDDSRNPLDEHRRRADGEDGQSGTAEAELGKDLGKHVRCDNQVGLMNGGCEPRNSCAEKSTFSKVSGSFLHG